MNLFCQLEIAPAGLASWLKWPPGSRGAQEMSRGVKRAGKGFRGREGGLQQGLPVGVCLGDKCSLPKWACHLSGWEEAFLSSSLHLSAFPLLVEEDTDLYSQTKPRTILTKTTSTIWRSSDGYSMQHSALTAIDKIDRYRDYTWSVFRSCRQRER